MNLEYNKICAIMQPTYLPWLGYFDLIDSVDVFVLLDNVQLVERSWHVRNRIKNIKGEELFLSIPIRKNAHFYEIKISDAELVNESKWQLQHFRKIEDAYRKAPFFKEIIEFIRPFYQNEYKYLADFTSDFIIKTAHQLQIKNPILRASSIGDFEEIKDKKTVKIVKAVGCDAYLSVKGSAEYINAENLGGEFVKTNMPLFYHNYQHPSYPQINGDFIPFLGIIDILFNTGIEKAIDFIKLGKQNKISYLEFQ